MVKRKGDTKVVGEIKDWNRIGFIDKNTILWNKSIFTDTGRRYSWGSSSSKIYKNNDGKYYYRDPAWASWYVWHHHLEVFDNKYNHIWTADPITWVIDYSKAVSGRSISNIMK